MKALIKIPSYIVLAVGMFLAAETAHAQCVGIPSHLPPMTIAAQPDLNADQEATTPARARTLDQVITRDAVFYLEINDVAAQQEALRLIDTLKSFWPFLASTPGPATDHEAALEALWTLLGPSLKGAQVAVAGWSPETATSSPGPKKKSNPLIGVFIKFASRDQLRQLLDKQEEIERAIRALRGKKSDAKKSDVNFTVLDDMAMFTEPGVLERVLLADPSARRLSDDPDFKLARERFADTPVFFYLDLDWMGAVALEEAKPPSSEAGETGSGQDATETISQLMKSFGVDRFHKLAAGLRFGAPQTIVRALVMEKRSEAAATQRSFNILKLAEVGLKPADWQRPHASIAVTLSLDWVGLYDGVMALLGQILAGSEPQGPPPAAMVEALFGYNLRQELLPALGSVLSLSLQSVDEVTSLLRESQGEPAIPKLTLLLGVRDRTVVEGALNNLKAMLSMGADPGADPGDEAPVEKINGVSIGKIGGFGYAVTDDALILGPDVEAIRQLIRAHETGDTLAQEADFVRGTQWMPRPLYAWAYVAPAATKTFFDSLRQEAITDEPQLAGLLARFSSPAQPIALASWQDSAGIATELRVPDGVLPLAMAAAVASKRADQRDRQLQEKLTAALKGNESLSDAQVSVRRGQATLSGTVKTEAAKSLAQQLVEKIEGVKSVVNELEVEPEQ